ncbi:putative major facilitator superfamily transporter [Polychaeton citri CBS 116435]|uniref:Major facilitator superfamily transporter n=1 Tax=Polychaeton citri CBS 116435 TaxID=1314669 RepID=A0A9P4ULI1_9PEZI|nr:putative major facilitator superfamily transporter [Polychaeton citri CBS 116435]
MPSKQTEAEEALHDQTQLLPKRELIIVFSTMALALLVCFIDQNGIGVLLPSIAKDLDAQSNISWAGTSALIANTIFQVLYGRLSDLFGRKKILISALVLLSLSDLACGLSVNPTMLYIFRGLAGVGNGGITSLSMMIISDVVTLQERGKYQGILGVMVGMGNAIGPLIASGFALHLTWRGLFWMLCPLILIAAGISVKYLPTNMPKLNVKQTVAKIDFLGLITGTAFVILVLIPISQGGHAGTPWDSPMVIAMLTVGIFCGIAFLFVEWKATLPMMPLDMFKRPSVAAMLAQSFLLGASYYSYLYFLPLYFQNVKGLSPIVSAALLLPLVVPQSCSSVLAGLYMSKFNRYVEVIYFGFGIWTVGSGLMIMADENTNVGLVSLFLILVGCGTGTCFQPTLVAMQAHCPKAQRAVVTSNRNFLRSLGAAVSLAVSSAILANVLKGSLPPDLASLANSTFAAPSLDNYSPEQRVQVVRAYASASRAVFIWCCPLTAVCLLLTMVVRDHGLQRKEEKEAEARTNSDIEKQEGAMEDGELGEDDDSREEYEVKGTEKASSVRVRRDRNVAAPYPLTKTFSVDMIHGPVSTDVSRRPSLSSEKSVRSAKSQP